MLFSLSSGEGGRLTEDWGCSCGNRKPVGSILHRFGGWMLGVRDGGDIKGVRVRGMLALVCPGSDMLRENVSFKESRPLIPSLSIALG